MKKAKRKEPKTFYCVMKAHGWESASVAGVALQPPTEGPQRFIPVFDTEEQAIAWAGSKEHIMRMESYAT